MITGDLKSKVDKIWDTLWSGGISNPLTVIEQLTYLLFIKRLDELHTLKERKAARLGCAIEEPIFAADEDGLRWSRFKDAAPEPVFEAIRDKVFPFMKTLGQKGESDGEGGSTYTHHMKDAIFMLPTPRVLANIVGRVIGVELWHGLGHVPDEALDCWQWYAGFCCQPDEGAAHAIRVDWCAFVVLRSQRLLFRRGKEWWVCTDSNRGQAD